MFSLKCQNTKHVSMFLFGSLLFLILEAGFCDCGLACIEFIVEARMSSTWSNLLLCLHGVDSDKCFVQRNLSINSCKAFSPTDIKGALEYIMSYKKMLWNIKAGMMVLIQLSTKYQNYVFVSYFSWVCISGIFSYWHISWNLCLKKWL